MKYEVREVRSVVYTVEVPNGVTPADLQAGRLDSMNFQARGSGGIIGESSELVSYTVQVSDDDEPAEVQLDKRLRDTWPPEVDEQQVLVSRD